MTLTNVFDLIRGERDYQNVRWANHKHRPESYLSYIDSYLREATDIDAHVDQDGPGHLAARSAIRKIAALCVACMEDNGVALPRVPFMSDFGECMMEGLAEAYDHVRPQTRAVLAVLSALDDDTRAMTDPPYMPEFSELLTCIRARCREAECEKPGVTPMSHFPRIASLAVIAMRFYETPAR